MGDHMIEKSFDEVVLFARTGLNPRTNFKLGQGTNNYITIKNIHNNSIVIDDNTDFVDDDAITLIHKRSQIKKGDILFCSIGRIGDMYIIPEEPKGWDINESVFAFTLNTNIIRQKYFYYIFKNQDTLDYLIQNSSGSTFKSIKMNQLKRMVFKLPSLGEQDKIVTILDKVSSVISMRKKQLSSLDKIIKSRFVEMFGDPIENLKGWTLAPISSFATVKIGPFGSMLHADDYIMGGHPLINPSHLLNNTIVPDNNLTLTETKYQELAAYQLQIGDVIIGRRGEIGRCAVVEQDGLFCGTGSMFVRIREKCTPDFLQKIISFPSFKAILEDKAVGVTMKNLNAGIIADSLIPLPPKGLQENYVAIVAQLNKTKSAIHKSLEETQLLFDSLMQTYFG